MALKKVHVITADDSGRIRWQRNAAINLDCIEYCCETDTSLKKEKWSLDCSYATLQLEAHMGEYATEIHLRSGETILVVDKIEYFCK